MTNSPVNSSIQVNMPKICARCGKEPVESVWPIQSKYDRSISAFPPVVVNQYKTAGFFVPVCKACKIELNSDSTKWYRIFTISGLFIIILFCVMICLSGDKSPQLMFALGIFALISVVIVHIKRAKYWGGSGIGSFDGRYFTFENKEFQREFAELNPSFVRTIENKQ